MKKIIRLTESDLVRLVKKAIKEQEENDFDFYMEELGEYANKVQWDEYRPKGKDMKQSAVEWLIGELKKYDSAGLKDQSNYVIEMPTHILTELEEQAKEMEKQQELMHNKMLEMLKIISNGFDDSKKHLIIKKAKELIKEITEI